MKILRTLFWCLSTTVFIWLLCGCSTSRLASSNTNEFNTETALTESSAGSLKRVQAGAELVFTNADVVMWVPSRTVHVWDGHTSVVYIDETTPPGAFVKEYKIEVEIEIADTVREFQQMERWSSSNWYFQEHPRLSIAEAQYGKQMRKDIWNPEKTRNLLINAMVKRSGTFEEDIETAKKMVESIKPISK